jgi:hypothetical protein
MVLKLKLPKHRFVWALVHPVDKGFIQGESGVGYQENTLILSQETPEKEVILEDLPKWAQKQVLTSIKAGELLNSGDSIQESSIKITKPTQTEKAKKKVTKKVTKKKNSE